MVQLCGRPVLEHTLRSLAAAGVTEAIVVQSPKPRLGDWPYLTPEEYFGDGRQLGLGLSYVTQEEATGQGDAMLLAATHLPDRFFVVQPENINAGEIATELVKAHDPACAGVVATQEKEETWLFGVFALKGGRVVDIVEKPVAGEEPSKLVNMWVALLDQSYLTALRSQPSHPHSSVFALKKLANERGLVAVVTKNPFFPLKFPWHLLAMRDYLFERQTGAVSPKAVVDSGARIEGNVVIEAGSQVAASAIIKGPAYIGPNVVIDEFVILRPGCVIEAEVTLRPYTDLFNTLVGRGTRIHRSYLANSILGEGIWTDANLAATNTNLHGGEVTVDVKGHTISTQLEKLGAVVGRGSRFGVNVTLLPGVMVGAGNTVAAGSVIERNLPDQPGQPGQPSVAS